MPIFFTVLDQEFSLCCKYWLLCHLRIILGAVEEIFLPSFLQGSPEQPKTSLRHTVFLFCLTAIVLQRTPVLNENISPTGKISMPPVVEPAK